MAFLVFVWLPAARLCESVAILSAMMELAVIVAAYVALGALRPRWTTLLAALIPAALAFAWLLLHEDVPGDELSFVDLAWYIGMSLAVGGVYALASAAGTVLRRGFASLIRAAVALRQPQ